MDQRDVRIGYEWLLEDGSWIPFKKEDCQLIAEKDERKHVDDFILKIEVEQRIYVLDFKDMTQINEKSGTLRPFRRVHSWGNAGPLTWSRGEHTEAWELKSIPFEGPDCFSPEVANVVGERFARLSRL